MRVHAFCLAALLAGMAVDSQAYTLAPEGTQIERKLTRLSESQVRKAFGAFAAWGVRKFGKPVHEEITNLIAGCVAGEDDCANPDNDPGVAYILAGVRWNDDPPFRFESGYGKYTGCKPEQTIRLVTQPECWARVFKDGKERASRGERLVGLGVPLMLRSHFGDFQFLHAMATADGVRAVDTQQLIMMWAEFTWDVATQRIKAGALVRQQKIDGLAKLFDRHEWQVQHLFGLGNPWIQQHANYLADVAFGSLLHMVEDSYSVAHVDRYPPVAGERCAGVDLSAPGAIRQFRSYVHQDSDKHAEADTRDALSAHLLSGKPDVVEVGQVLYRYREQRASWKQVKPYMTCLFRLSSDVMVAGPGDGYKP